jgi:excinuclease UvrABC ATPase subunit
MGPEAGDGGGKQVAAKTPQALALRPGRSHTGRALRDFLENRWETALQESHDGP